MPEHPPSGVSQPIPRWLEQVEKHANHLLNAQQDTSTQLDRAVLSLSSAGLGLSLLILKDFLPLPSLALRVLFVASWTSFLLAILATVVGFSFSVKLTRDMYLKFYQFLADYPNVDRSYTKESRWLHPTKCANATALSFFVLAVVLLWLTATASVLRGGIMADETTKTDQTTGKIEKGYVPADPPLPKKPPIHPDSGSTGQGTPEKKTEQ